MTNKKYILKGNINADQLCLDLIQNSNTLSKIKFMFQFFEKIIRWENSYLKMSDCVICSNSLDPEDCTSWMKLNCKICGIVYHLNCLYNIKKTQAEEGITSFTTNLFVNFANFEIKRSGICLECNTERKKEMQKEKEEKKQEKEKPECLNSIESGGRSLRLNKTRIALFVILIINLP